MSEVSEFGRLISTKNVKSAFRCFRSRAFKEIGFGSRSSAADHDEPKEEFEKGTFLAYILYVLS